jgi:hypothetical protein
MPKQTRETTPGKPVLKRDRLAEEAKSLRQRAKQAHAVETRIELEEMAERREILAVAVEAIEAGETTTAQDEDGDATHHPAGKPPGTKP